MPCARTCDARWPACPTVSGKSYHRFAPATIHGDRERVLGEYRERQVIELLKFEDLSVRDVAARLGMSEANVKVTAHRGYRALRRQIEEWTRAD